MRSLPVPFSPSIRMEDASLTATRRTKLSTSRMALRFGDDLTLGWLGLLGDVLNGRHHAFERTAASSRT